MSITVRPLDTAEHTRFRLARMAAVEAVPYFGHALFALSAVAAEGLETFAVDANWRLYMDPALLTCASVWSIPQTAGVLVHEVNHLLREHSARANAVETGVDRVRWNYAADAEINDDLIAAGIVLPEGCVTPASLGVNAGDTAEVYYRHLAGRNELSEHSQGSNGGCGSGCGERGAVWELPREQAMRGQAGLSRAEADMVRKATARQIAAKGRGTIPAGMQRWASDVLAPPKVPWTRLLSAAVRRAVGQQSGMVSRTYTRPARRSTPDVLLPAWRAPKVAVDVIVDTSGSMSSGDLAAALAEVAGVLKALAVSKVRLACCDAAATTLRPVRTLSDVELTGGGGTDMRVGIGAALAQGPKSSVIVVLTDGDTPWPSDAIGVPLIVVLIGAGERQRQAVPRWARVVSVDSVQAAA